MASTDWIFIYWLMLKYVAFTSIHMWRWCNISIINLRYGHNGMYALYTAILVFSSMVKPRSLIWRLLCCVSNMMNPDFAVYLSYINLSLFLQEYKVNKIYRNSKKIVECFFWGNRFLLKQKFIIYPHRRLNARVRTRSIHIPCREASEER